MATMKPTVRTRPNPSWVTFSGYIGHRILPSSLTRALRRCASPPTSPSRAYRPIDHFLDRLTVLNRSMALRGARTPPLMHPNPMVGMAPDHPLEDLVEASGVFDGIAVAIAATHQLDFWQHMDLVVRGSVQPDQEDRKHDRIGHLCKTREARMRRGRHRKEVGKHAPA